MCSLAFLLVLTAEAQRKNVNRNCKKGKLAPSVWLGTNLLKIETVFVSNNWKFNTKIRETFLSFGKKQITIGNNHKYMLLTVECHPIIIFQSVPLVLFVMYETNFKF